MFKASITKYVDLVCTPLWFLDFHKILGVSKLQFFKLVILEVQKWYDLIKKHASHCYSIGTNKGKAQKITVVLRKVIGEPPG